MYKRTRRPTCVQLLAVLLNITFGSRDVYEHTRGKRPEQTTRYDQKMPQSQVADQPKAPKLCLI